ncbi:unnamed protein product [Cuscuta epithymum]|uniref:ATPase inhibitor n=1 Tax=Cuscuta epithymum TaxID=186058 RepID=A0AAV0EDH1_9ASTE|nr:unnamed protein product [Cuscuta epithymum]
MPYSVRFIRACCSSFLLSPKNMALRSAFSSSGLRRLTECSSFAGRLSAMGSCCFSNGSGRILSDEQRAKEILYIQKMEKERLEKQKNEEEDKAEVEKKEEGINFQMLV